MSNIPNIRFKGFSESWEQRKLKEFGKATGGTSIESEFCETGKYKVISIGSYSENSKYTDQGIRVDETSKTKSRILNKNDLTIILNDKTSSGNIIGRVLLINADDTYVYNQRTERIEVYKNDFESAFLYQFLNADNIRKKIIKASQGNTQIYVNWTAICEIIYKVPKSKEEQQKIANLLDKLDNLITLHQRKCDGIKELKKYMLQKLFPKKDSNIPEIRFTGFTYAWEQRKLGELAKIVGGGTPSTNIDEYWDGDIDWYAPAELSNQIYINSSERKISLEGFNNCSAKMLPAGSVLFTSRAGIGKMAILQKESCTNQGFQSIVPIEDKLDSYFIFSRARELKNYGESVGAGSTFVEVSGKQMSNMSLMMPNTIDEQKEISKVFKNLDNLITLHQRKCDELKEIKKYMLSNMFTKGE